MRRILLLAFIATLSIFGYAMMQSVSPAAAQPKEEAMLSHDVYFSLKNNSADAKKKLVAACKKYLKGHDGEVFFGVGPRVKDLTRDVNDQDFDVALHIVFKDLAAHDTYQKAKRHLQFIDENKDNWKKVRVFDSIVDR